MNEQEHKRYELWMSEGESSDSFFSADNRSARFLLAPDCKLIGIIEASSRNEAQQKRYDLMGWGHYRTIEKDEVEPQEKWDSK